MPLTTFHGIEFGSGKLLAEKSPFVHQAAQSRGQLESADSAGVDDDNGRFETLCHVDGLQSQANGPLPVTWARGGELVAVRLIDQHLRRERAEVMQTGDNEWDFLPQFEHLVNDGRAQPVAQFDGIESEIENLPE